VRDLAPRSVLDPAPVAAFCRRHYIRRLVRFGSVLRADIGPAEFEALMGAGAR
jgi:hypothetical protein